MVRRVSSPAGHASVLTPRSNCSFTGGPGSTPSEAAGTPSQQLQLQHSGAACAGFTASGNNNSGWPSHLMQLPSDLGLGDACGDDPSGMRMAAAQQQPTAQQQLAQSSLNSETMSALLAGSILGGPSGFGDLIGRAVDSSGDLCGVLGVSSSVPPPPPPPAQQHSMLAQPPPPPRSAEGYSGAYGGSDGRLSGTSCLIAFLQLLAFAGATLRTIQIHQTHIISLKGRAVEMHDMAVERLAMYVHVRAVQALLARSVELALCLNTALGVHYMWLIALLLLLPLSCRCCQPCASATPTKGHNPRWWLICSWAGVGPQPCSITKVCRTTTGKPLWVSE